MLIQSFKVENFRGFREEQLITLAPLTLFYGENSAGKSSLARLLPWIAESMADSRPGPCLDGLVAREALWQDLAHSSNSGVPIKVALAWAGGQRAEWTFRFGRLAGSCEIRSLSLSGPTGSFVVQDDGDGTWEQRLQTVRGLLPNLDPREAREHLGLTTQDYQVAVQWLQGVRVSVPRVEKANAAPPQILPPDGAGVARFLYHWDRMARSEAHASASAFVGDYYHRLGLELRTTEIAPGFFRPEVALQNSPAPGVSLMDTGEGLTQVLAPLVALARAVTGLGPKTVVLEQPELHLHTDAQRALAESIVMASQRGAQVLVETHSEVLLASVQLAVAATKLVPEDVALYWLSRKKDGTNLARRVELDSRGRVGSAWPIDAFGDLLRLKGDLFRAQRGAS